MTMTAPSLEALVETGILPGSIFHPGGLEVSKELAAFCGIGPTSDVLDVACGTGETACFLAGAFGCRVVGIDATELQVERAREKAAGRRLSVEFRLADAHHLPFPDGMFDAVISEATLCHLEIDQALRPRFTAHAAPRLPLALWANEVWLMDDRGGQWAQRQAFRLG